jgi:hypothetical protein
VGWGVFVASDNVSVGADAHVARRALKLVRLSQALDLLSARIRQESADPAVALTLRRRFGACAADIAAIQAEISLRLQGRSDASAEALRRLHGALGGLSQALTPPEPVDLAAAAVSRPAERRAAALAARLDGSARLLLLQIKAALVVGAGVLAFSAQPAAAGCSTSSDIASCTGDVSGGAAYTYPDIDTLLASGITSDIDPASGTSGFSLTAQGGGGSGGAAFTDGDGGGGGQPLSATIDTGGHSINTTHAPGVLVKSVGGQGGGGGDAGAAGSAGNGGQGGSGGAVSVTFTGAITTTGDTSSAIVAVSAGGRGGNGGNFYVGGGSAGDGGAGGAGGSVYVDFTDGTLHTSGKRSYGIFAASVGGAGGNAGSCSVAICASSSGGNAAHGSGVEVDTAAGTLIQTTGSLADGIHAVSIGGFGGDGGDSYVSLSFASNGASAGSGGDVLVKAAGEIDTTGDHANGVFAQSVGGGGGSGGDSSLTLVSIGGNGSQGGDGGSVTVQADATSYIHTTGVLSRGIFAQSIGGGGGDGGDAGGLVSIGGDGTNGSHGGNVSVTNAGVIWTQGLGGDAIFAQSVGGGGGSGGGAGGLVAVGGKAADGAIAGAVTVDNSGALTVGGADAFGIFAQSVGGSGGDGGTVAGTIAVGGGGGTGGDGGNVNVTNTGSVSMTGGSSGGVFAQSVGGGGGFGGGAISLGAFVNVSVGGSGGAGGKGGKVVVKSSGPITTVGDRSAAIFAQSVGGGGGGGGFAAGVSAGAFGDVSIGVGGGGGAGGDGGAVSVKTDGLLSTQGADSDGVFAQSVGGGGGTGGFAVAAAIAGGEAAVSGSVAVGGAGGAAGNGATVSVVSTGSIQTLGDRSAGIYAQSVGGGGGAGGWSGAVAAAGGATAGAIGVSVGGGGGVAGHGGTVTVEADNQGTISTGGQDAAGVFAQSVGGGGGTGGFSVAGAAAVGESAGGASVAVGGGGGAGGAGGLVKVTTDVAISTTGDRSYGVQAQSIGGGGGAGGWSGAITGALSEGATGALSLTVGGAGGAAGNGGEVLLTSQDTITTTGADAHGLFAQSVGGGGGSGGFSVSGALSAGSNNVNIGAAFGGSGGGGGDGGQVILTSSANVLTTGERSYGIYAQSVGGGGGDGGWAGALSGGVSETESVSLGFTLGGGGGTAGGGGAVSVTSSGVVETTGADSYAVFAQSVGGGGGAGGLALSGSFGAAKSANLSLGLGGAGGAGGIGGDVSVNVSGQILTTGDGASGVFAESVGGGGGAGGAAGALAFSGSKSVNLSMNIGGFGGSGSIGGTVTVDNTGVIQTQGEGAHGIFAESVGGGGGHGGMAGIDENQWGDYLAGGAASTSFGSETANISLALGGFGGTGANGGLVTVDNSGAILVSGDDSNAIYAQSVGGGGGDAGVATAASGSFGAGKNGTFAVAMGGFGGEAGNGGQVKVTNSGALITTADGSDGVYAQSVGGGGGAGGDARGFALSYSNKKAAENSPKATSVSVSIGGYGGAAGTGGEVDVLNSGVILTSGTYSVGVFAQSVGGGGGQGGLVSAQGQEITEFLSLANKGDAKGGDISIGGFGAGGGDGGLVKVNNTGLIATQGVGAQGVFAQSVGGGGGQGGSGLSGTVSVGGGGGVAGDGGEVQVTNSGGIYTQGSLADGIVAQSVGGGGGDGGATDFQGETYTYRQELADTMTVVHNLQDTVELAKSFKEPAYGIQIGGMGGASGNGGAVTVTNNGVIQTTGDLANGIFAQSVGGGGGTGGMGVIGQVGQIAVSGAGGSAGDGGDVKVVNTGTIRTSGFGAYGIYAQSVGGGGGVAGDTSLGIAEWGNLKFAGGGDYSQVANLSINPFAGNGGNGGNVTVVNTGDIILMGAGSVGIFAQSVGGGGGQYGSSVGLSFAGSFGGNGTAGTVTIVQNGNIYALGKNGIGAFFQSDGGTGDKNIDATLNGAVVGGDVYGLGVLIDGGVVNTINLNGLTTALSNLAIVGTTGDDTINSFVGVTGNVDLGSGANAFNNFEHSTFTTLDYVRLNGGLLTNLGLVTPGGTNFVQTTALDGSYLQGPGGAYNFDLDLKFTGKPGEADLMAATGTAQLQGKYVLNPMDPGDALPGSHVATIISADGGLSASNLELDAPASLVARFELIHNVQDLDIHYTIDFSPDDIGLNPNQVAVGDHINAIQTAGSPAFSPIAAQLFFVSDPGTLKAIYNSFSPEPYADQIAATYLASERFADSMMSCPLSSPQFHVRGDSCAWVKATGTWLGLSATANNQGFTEQAAGVAGGYEKQVGEHLKLGYALSAENVTGGMGLRSDASGGRYQGGLVAKGDWSGWGLDLAAAYGTEKLQTSRTVLTPQQGYTAYGHQRLTWQAYTARLSHTWRYDGRSGSVYAKPMFEAGYAHVRNGPLAETGAGPLDLVSPAQTQTETRISPKLELGAETVSRGVSYRPYVRAGFTRVLDGDAPLFEAAFSSAPAGVGTFPGASKLDRTTADAEAGVTIVGSTGVSARLGWFGQFGKRTNEQGMALKVTLPF